MENLTQEEQELINLLRSNNELFLQISEVVIKFRANNYIEEDHVKRCQSGCCSGK